MYVCVAFMCVLFACLCTCSFETWHQCDVKLEGIAKTNKTKKYIYIIRWIMISYRILHSLHIRTSWHSMANP